MREIQGKAKTIRELLKEVKYSIDYYQREYKWGSKQIKELLSDLAGKFLEDYRPEHDRGQVAKYPHYFLGSIIISKKGEANYIVDGQQRLTSLTLLLVLLRNLQKQMENQVKVDDLIFSERYGKKSYNLDVDERRSVMEALFEGQSFDDTEKSESVQNLWNRYHDLNGDFPEELSKQALPYFVDWLLENVHFIEITAYSDDDAYTIFETMNDRGLSLSPTDMLKGYLLSNVHEAERTEANREWRRWINALRDLGKEHESDFFKVWFRSQYSHKIRERKKGASPEDFERIHSEFHRWLRDTSGEIGLNQNKDFTAFIHQDLAFYCRQYVRIIQASREVTEGLEHVYYNARNGFALQYMLLLAPLSPVDSDETVIQKIALVSKYLDILLTWRLWNFRSIAHGTMQYSMFLDMRDIRGLTVPKLATTLHQKLSEEPETFANKSVLRVHQQNRKKIHLILARITDHVSVQSGMESRYAELIGEGKTKYEVEHVWSNSPERHEDEFSHQTEFLEYRDRIGGLLILPKSFNASYGALPYEEKVNHYDSQNLLARSLHTKCYDRNPGFIQFLDRSGLPFVSKSQFKKADLDSRGELYRQLAELIWNPSELLD